MRIVLVVLGVLFLMAMPAFAASASVIDRVATTDRVVALTLEDIQSTSELEKLISICEKENIRVTFFMSSQVAEFNRLLVKKTYDKGNELGNYGVNHKYWGETKEEDISSELKLAGDALQKVTGSTGKIIRPPFSYYENNFLQAAANYLPECRVVRGMDTSDWALKTPQSVVEKVKSSVSPGDIININMQVKPAAAALPEVISELKGMGYKIITVSELVAKAPVQLPPKPVVVRPFAVFSHIAVDSPKVALTFDDGGSRYRVTEILDILKSYGVPCTFFLSGNWVEDNAELAQRIWADGHEIANHSYSHPAFTLLGRDEIESELANDEEAVKKGTGQPIKKYFRPPYGDYNSAVAQAVQDVGYQAIVLWDIDTRDWSGVSAQNMINRVLNQVSSGSIVLFHLHGANTPEAISEIIPSLKAQGYILTTISNMLE